MSATNRRATSGGRSIGLGGIAKISERSDQLQQGHRRMKAQKRKRPQNLRASRTGNIEAVRGAHQVTGAKEIARVFRIALCNFGLANISSRIALTATLDADQGS